MKTIWQKPSSFIWEIQTSSKSLSQHDIFSFNWLQELFLNKRVNVFPPCLLNSGFKWQNFFKPVCKDFFFYTNLLFHTHHTFFCKFHKVWISQLAKIWCQISVQAWSTQFELPQNKYFCEIKIIFCYKTIWNNAEFT